VTLPKAEPIIKTAPEEPPYFQLLSPPEEDIEVVVELVTVIAPEEPAES
jgi:hypothetical protein